MVAERPLTGLDAASLAPVRDATRLGSVADWPAFCSNFFFMSLTVALAAAGVALPVAVRILVPSLFASLSSTGLEAERKGGLVWMRLAGPVGGLEEVALLVDLDGGVWRLAETTEAIGSRAGDSARPCGSDS